MDVKRTAEPNRGSDPSPIPRRLLFERLGWGGLSAFTLLTLPGLVRFLRPSSQGGGGGTIDIGSIDDYRSPVVTTRWVKRHRIWIVRDGERLFALEARCTHLGCTPRWTPEHGVFRCPCHGSRFSPDGSALNGPAVEPLTRVAIRTDNEQVLVNLSRKATLEEAEVDPDFFVVLG